MNEPETVIEGTSALQTLPANAEQPLAFRLLENAAARGASMAELEKFMDLADRWQAGEARKAFVAAMSAFKAETINIVKDKANLQYKSRYISLGNLVQTVTPFLSKHGLHFNWDQDQSQDGRIRIIGTMTHAMGHSETSEFVAPPDNSGQKNAIQQIKSSITYGRAVVFEALCGIAATDANLDDDGNGTTIPRAITEACEEIAKAQTVDGLQKIFTAAYKEANGHKASQAELIAAKDKRKAELTKGESK